MASSFCASMDPTRCWPIAASAGWASARASSLELVDTESLAAGRRERRRRRMRTALVVAVVALAAGVLAVAIDPGVEHGKTLNGRSGEIRVR